MNIANTKLIFCLLMSVISSVNAAAFRGDRAEGGLYVFKPATVSPDGSPLYVYNPDKGVEPGVGSFDECRADVIDEEYMVDLEQGTVTLIGMRRGGMPNESSNRVDDDADLPRVVIDMISDKLGYIEPLTDFGASRPADSKLVARAGNNFVEIPNLKSEFILEQKGRDAEEVKKLFNHDSDKSSPRDILMEISSGVGGKYIKKSGALCTHVEMPHQSCMACLLNHHSEVYDAVGMVKLEQLKFQAARGASKPAGGAGSGLTE